MMISRTRLIQAASSMNGMLFADLRALGNLTQNGSTNLSVDPTTNRIITAGYGYDANGNLTQSPNGAYSYDVANRLVSNGAIYDPRNQRVMDANGYFYLHGEAGELLGKYQLNWGRNSVAYIQGSPAVYFAGRMIADVTQGWVMADRLGSVRLNQSGERSNYQAYGTEITSTSQNRTKFGTYWQDSSALNYAGQRYYTSGTGRFLTPDPGGISTADPRNPGSWNRYAYVAGDPINFFDPTGTYPCGSTWAGSGTYIKVTVYDCSPGTVGSGDMEEIGGVPDKAQDPGGGGGSGPTTGWPAPLSPDCLSALGTAHTNAAAVGRALAYQSTLQVAVQDTDISWKMLAAVGIRETGFANIAEYGGGYGRGVFQIDIGKNPSVTEAQAYDVSWAAQWAANLLNKNMGVLSSNFPNLTPTQLLQATAASYNFGTKNISGNPNTIDVGTTGYNYGSNVLAIMTNCFH